MILQRLSDSEQATLTMTSGSRACANWALKASAWVRDWRRRFGAGYARSNNNTGTKQKAGIGFDALLLSGDQNTAACPQLTDHGPLGGGLIISWESNSISNRLDPNSASQCYGLARGNPRPSSQLF
jgi:hypothetical protein